MKEISRRRLLGSGVAGLLASRVNAQTEAAQTKAAQTRTHQSTKARLPRPVRNAHLSAGTSKGEWRTYGGDLDSQRYSPLTQIDRSNFHELKPAFAYSGADHQIQADPSFQASPLMVRGVLYFTTGTYRTCVAADAKTGKQLWQYSLDEAQRGQASPRPGGGHGVSYWTDGTQERIFFVTVGYRLVGLDAKTGQPVPSFGVEGVVDLKLNDDQNIPLDGSGRGNEIGLHSTPLVVGDVVVVGAAHSANAPVREHIKGYVRGFDAKTGKRLWIFHTVPNSREFGYSTWGNNSADWTGNTGNWAQNSADPELGLVYLSIEQPTDDYYGAFRPGANLFGDCIVAVNAMTGERVWYYQTVHHDIWDRDIDTPAILCDLTVDRRKIRALVIFAKSGLVFVLDRVTGKPVWPIPEVAVPAGDVPGEYYAPTQPIPNRPPPCDVTGIAENDLIDFTPALRAEAVALMKNYRMGPLFNPPCVSQWPGPLGAILNPAGNGSVQWTGGSYDPETQMAYIFSGIDPLVVGLVPGNPAQTNLDFVRGTATDDNENPAAGRGRGGRGRGPGGGQMAIQGMSYLKPPYGRITAYDMNKGEIAWMTPHGETPDVVKNNPALKGMNIPRTGNGLQVGTLVTKTLLIAGDGAVTTGADGKVGGWLRAYDKATGRELAAIPIPGRTSGCPITYMLDGKQYIAVGIVGPNTPAQLAVFVLP